MEVGTLYGHAAWIPDVEFSKNGSTIFSRSMDGTLRTWETPLLDEIIRTGKSDSTH